MVSPAPWWLRGLLSIPWPSSRRYRFHLERVPWQWKWRYLDEEGARACSRYVRDGLFTTYKITLMLTGFALVPFPFEWGWVRWPATLAAAVVMGGLDIRNAQYRLTFEVLRRQAHATVPFDVVCAREKATRAGQVLEQELPAAPSLVSRRTRL